MRIYIRTRALPLKRRSFDKQTNVSTICITVTYLDDRVTVKAFILAITDRNRLCNSDAEDCNETCVSQGHGGEEIGRKPKVGWFGWFI